MALPRVTFVRGSLVRDGAWWCHPTAEVLAGQGISSITPALPSCDETGVEPGTGRHRFPSMPQSMAATVAERAVAR